MHDMTAEQLADRIVIWGLMTREQVESCLALAGGRGRATLEDFKRVLLTGGYLSETELAMAINNPRLTNWQLQRIRNGHRTGFSYGKWQVLYLVGTGTRSRVYRASNIETNDIKSVKVLRNRYTDDADTRKGFLQHTQRVMKLRHPNIVAIHEIGEQRGRVFTVIDFIEGINLREYVQAHRRLRVTRCLDIIDDVIAALEYAFDSHGMCHGNLKISSVLPASGGKAQLHGFDIPTPLNDEVPGNHFFEPRKIDYAGLEKLTGAKPNDIRSDIYFVGCMLYQMLTGIPPLSEIREKSERLSASRFEQVIPITEHDPNLPGDIANLVNRLMDLDPDKRIQSPAAVRREIASARKAMGSNDYLCDIPSGARSIPLAPPNGKTIWVIEGSLRVQDDLWHRLTGLGYRVLNFGDPDTALERLREPKDNTVRCVIFGCTGLGPDAISAFKKFALGETTKNLPAILLVPEALEANVDSTLLNGHRIKLTMPFKFPQLEQALRKLC